MPNNAPVIKRGGTAALGAEIVTVGSGSEERKIRAEELAEQHGYVIVPPFNDEFIIAGQGTMGLEILEDLPDVETVLVPVGGGGMLSGIAAADAQASLRAGHIVNWSAEQVTRTLADGLRTQSLGDITFAHIQRFVDDIVTVSEEEIREAVRRLSVNPKLAAEPSGAVAVAAFLFHRQELPQTTRNVAILSGGNIDPALLKEIQGERSLHHGSRH
jgi:threonine dehydratase